VQLVDPSGKIVRDYGSASSNSVRISKNDLSAGIYFVQVSDKERILTREKLIVQ